MISTAKIFVNMSISLLDHHFRGMRVEPPIPSRPTEANQPVLPAAMVENGHHASRLA
jgi:hypothetical protein